MGIKAIAFIPARSGSKRVPDKNVRRLGGHPLLAYSIRAAIDSGEFASVVCATDSVEYAEIARSYGAEVPFLRPPEISGDKSPDIEWVVWTLKALNDQGRAYDAFSILRPTSPFRLSETIQRAWSVFRSNPEVDSLRAMSKCTEHPGKMWVVRGNRALPIMPFGDALSPWHSSQYAALPEIYVQNASLEIAWCRIALEDNSISGVSVLPFISRGFEGFDINRPEDFIVADHYINTGEARLPPVPIVS